LCLGVFAVTKWETILTAVREAEKIRIWLSGVRATISTYSSVDDGMD
jgi:hypothetical protein